ncbi:MULTISPECIES: ribonuclease toxin immunity protein CdiI [Paenibacillus]|uniref:ribonuclease toxin immunity protein CdiI n=1 Tax=Paenibacillus TaxID=44249 RepID=UPI0009FAF5BE|nr:ribonuclease toxin immunity protein CdiI [Paenibacillus borealis]
MKNLLDSTDLVNIEHSPIHHLINACYHQGSFKKAVKYLSTKVGFGIDLGDFTFWNDLDEYDKALYEDEFNGIHIELGSESVILDYEIFYYYLELAAKRYIEKKQEDEQDFQEYFENMKKILNIKGIV